MIHEKKLFSALGIEVSNQGEATKVSETSKRFNEFLISVFDNDFAYGLMKSLEWLNFSDNKKDLIMTIFKIDPNYELESLKELDESQILKAYLKLTGLILEYEGANPCLYLDEGLKLNSNYRRIVTFSYPIPIFLLDKGLTLFFSDLKSLNNLNGLPDGLEQLRIDCCKRIESLEGLPAGLKQLSIRGCDKLESLGVLPEGLEKLTVESCLKLTSLGVLPDGLKELVIKDCSKLQSIECLAVLAGLQDGTRRVIIHECPNY